MRDQEPSNSRTHLLLARLSGGIFAVDRSATIPCPNVLVHTLALQPDTAFGKPLTTLLDRAGAGALRFDETLASHLSMNRRTEWPRTAGGRYLIGLSASPCRDPERTIPGAALAFREISRLLARQQERHRAELLASVGFIQVGIGDEVHTRRKGIRDESTGGAASTEEPSHVRPHRYSYPHPR